LSDSNTVWKNTHGKIYPKDKGPRGVCKSHDGGVYYISNFEPSNTDIIPEGTPVEFDYGHPADHRGVAKNIKVISNE